MRLTIEICVGGPGSSRLPIEARLVYLVVLDATLAGVPVTASRISLISNIRRTTVRRKLQGLKADGIVSYGGGGWRITDEYLVRPELQTWVSRLEGMVRRAHDIIQNDKT